VVGRGVWCEGCTTSRGSGGLGVRCGGRRRATDDDRAWPLAREDRRPSRGAVTALATVAEGDAALTIDSVGDVHLWPTFDGTREPCLVDISDVHELAIAHHGDVRDRNDECGFGCDPFPDVLDARP